MTNVPAPAVAGSNVPSTASVIPIPNQVPPAVTAVRLTAASAEQNGPAAVIVASGGFATVIDVVFESGQTPAIE